MITSNKQIIAGLTALLNDLGLDLKLEMDTKNDIIRVMYKSEYAQDNIYSSVADITYNTNNECVVRYSQNQGDYIYTEYNLLNYENDITDVISFQEELDLNIEAEDMRITGELYDVE